MTRPTILTIAASPALDRYLWFPSFERGAVNRPDRVEVRPGGKALNSARVLRALGLDVVAVAPVHPSETADWQEELAGEEIDLIAVPCSMRSRATVTCIDRARGSATEIYEPSAPLQASEWAAFGEAVLRRLGDGGIDGLVIAGSRPGRDSPVLADVVRAASALGIPVYVDGVGEPVVAALRAGPTLIKVNVEEASALLGSLVLLTPADAARALLELGPSIAVVTAGVDGGACATGEGVIAVPPPRTRGPFPGGSGDAFLAGFIAAHLAGRSVPTALERGRACAEENAASPYAGSIAPREEAAT